MTNQPYSALLFDLDGTLVDSLPDIAASMNEVLKTRGLPTHPESAYRIFVGDGMLKLAERVLPEARSPEHSANDLVGDMKEVYARRWRDSCKAYPGIDELLLRLESEGYLLGILSNKPEAFTVEMVQFLFGERNWSQIRGAREGVPVKPDPTSALDIAKTWQLEASRILYVGDTSTDMLTAKHAGFDSVGVTWGFRDRAELEAYGATYLADRAEDILHIAGSGASASD